MSLLTTKKRFLSVALTFALMFGLVGYVPGGALDVNAKSKSKSSSDASSVASVDASIVPTDAPSLFMASDKHTADDKLTSILSQVSADASIKAVLLNGDFVNNTDTDTLANITKTVKTGLNKSSINVFYTYASHDENVGENAENFYFEGPINLGACYLYGIDFDGMTVSADAIEDAAKFTKWVESLDDMKPILVTCHVPLHARRGDNYGAIYWADALNNACAKHDVIYTWGHNHTGESDLDKAVYYVEPGGSLVFEDGTGSSSSSSSSKSKKSSSSDASANASSNATVVGGAVKSGKSKSKSSSSSSSSSASVSADPTPINFTYVNTGYIKSGYGSVVTFASDKIYIRRYSTSALSEINVIEKKHVALGDETANDIYTYTYKYNNKATFKKDGKMTYYEKSGKITTTYLRTVPKIKGAALSCTTYKYNGKAKKPTVTVTGSDGKVIPSTFYTVTYAKGRKKVGTYKVTVKMKGMYSGKKVLKFKIKKK